MKWDHVTSYVWQGQACVLDLHETWHVNSTPVWLCVSAQGVTSWFVFYLIKAKGVEDAAQVGGARTTVHAFWLVVAAV